MNIRTDAAQQLVQAINKNNTLEVNIRTDAAQAINKNNTLEELWLSHYIEDVKKRIRSLLEEVSKNREIRGCQTKLKVYFV